MRFFLILSFLFPFFLQATNELPCRLALFHDHKVRVDGKVSPVFPGAGYISAALAIIQKTSPNKKITLDARIPKPFFLDSSDSLTVTTSDNKILVTSPQDEGNKNGHFATSVLLEDLQPQACSMPQIPAEATKIDIKKLYEDLSVVGLKYGPHFKGLKSASVFETKAYGTLFAPEDLTEKGYAFHPAILDSAFHLIAAFASKVSDKIFVPILFPQIEYYGNPSETMYAEVSLERLPTEMTKTIQADITLRNDQGQIVMKITHGGFAAVQFSKPD